MNPSEDQLMNALRKADAAGDVPAAQAIARRIKAMRDQPKASERSTAGDFGQGMWQGLKDTAQGVGQIAVRGGPMAGVYDMAQKMGLMPENAVQESLDNAVKQSNEDWRNNPASQTLAGGAGQFIGGTVATAPLAPVAAPARGAGMLNNMLRAGTAGGIGAMSGSTEGDFTSGKAKQAAIGGTVGAAAGGGLHALQRGAENLVPSNATANVLNTMNRKANKQDFAKQGEALAKRTGVQLSPGAISGSKAQTMAENAARQSIFSRDLAFKADQRTAQQVTDHIGRIIENTSSRGGSAGTVGERVRGLVGNEVTRLRNQRAKVAADDYGAIDALTKGKLQMPTDGYAGTLKRTIDEFSAASSGSDEGRIAAQLKELLGKAKLPTEEGQEEAFGMTAKGVMQARRFLSQVAGGQANIAKSTGHGIQRKVARELIDALDNDLDAAADQLGGNVGDMLRTANGRYREYSQQIEAVQNTPLGKLMGEEFAMEGVDAFNKVPPEKIISKIKSLEPSEVKTVRALVEGADPAVWQDVKRRVLEDALETGMNAAPSEGANTLAISGNKFVNALARNTKDQQRLKAMYSPRELAEINDAFEVIRRWGDRTGFNFSGTAAQSEALGFMNTLKDVALKGSASAAGQVIGVRSVAKLMNDQAGRRALLEIKRLPPQSQRYRQLAATIAGIAAGKEIGQSQDGQSN